jgi:uncharacterized protein YndB with AHSA1/START domain
MSTDTKASVTTQVYEVYIRATPQAIWDGAVEYEMRPGGAYRAHSTPEMQAMGMPDVVVDGVVEVADAPRRLVHTYRFLFSDEMKSEGFTRITWEIEMMTSGFSRLTVSHELEGAPIMAGMVASKFSEMGGGGWAWILSDLKTLLETGSSM